MMQESKEKVITPERLDSLKLFQEQIAIHFADLSLLDIALTHSSYCNLSNERLEFLGDSIVDMVVGEYVFERKPHASEGKMTDSRSDLVREEALAEAARGIELGSYLQLGEGEIKSGGAEKTSILSNAYEALIAAIYLEEGLEEAREFIHDSLIRREKSIPKKKNYKSLLQEAAARKGRRNPTYRVVYEEGPDHRKTFTVEALVDGEVAGTGHGKSKKIAEQRAAKEAIRNLKMEMEMARSTENGGSKGSSEEAPGAKGRILID